MNKIVTILVAAMLYLVPATYAQTSFTMSPATINGNQGETVTVSMVVNNFNDMLSAQYGITWDPAVLQYSAVSNFNLQDLSAGSFNVNQAGDFLSFSWFDNSASGVTVDDGTTIFTMDFVVLGDASSGTMLSFADRPGLIIELVNTAGDITNSTVLSPTQFGDPNGNGGGNAGSGNTSPLVSGISTASGNNGTTVCVDVSVGNFTDITAMDYSLVWDASVIQYAEIRNINLAGLTQSSFNTSNSANGQLGVSWANSAGATAADGNIYQLCFNVLGNAGTSSNIAFGNAPTPINVTTTASTTDVGITQTTGLVSVNNTTPPPPPPTSTGTNLINIAALDAPAGSNVCVPVTVNDFDLIASLQFSLSWDPAILEYTGVQNITLQDLNEGTFNATQSANGQLALAWFDNTAQGVTLADGTAIFEMCFTVLGASGTGSSIVFTDTPTPREAAQPNGTVDFTETNGAVTVDGGTVTPPVDPPPTDTTGNPTAPAGDKLVNIAAVNTPAGSTVCVPVTVNDFDLIASLQFSLSWDPSVLQFTEVRGFNLPELSAGSFNTTQASNGQAALAWFDNTAQGVTLADGSTIFEMCFTVMGTDGSSSSIVFTDTPTAREAAQPNNTVPFTETNGSVTIGDGTAPPVDPPVTPGAGDQLVNIATMNAMAGSTVCVPVTVNDFDLIASLQFSLAWDPAVLQFTEVRNFNLPELSAGSFNTAQASNGQAAVAWFDNTAQGVTLTDGSTIFELCFTVIGATGTNSTIVFTDTPTAREAAQPNNTVDFTETNGGVNVNDGTVNPPDTMPPVGDGIINITPTTGAPGATICVPVTVKDFDAIASMQFSLSWDPAVLTFTQAENFNLKDFNAGSVSSDNAASGQLAIAWFDQAAQGVTLPDGTTIFELCFTVAGAAGTSTTISFTDTPTARELATASNTIDFSSSDGTITVETGVIEPPVGDGIINIASVNSPAGSSICIPVSVKDFNAIASMQFSLAWDPAVLSFTGTGSEFNLKDLNAGSFSTNNAASGQLALAWFDQAAQGVTLDDGTIIFELCFDVVGADGASTLISFTDIPTAREIATASMTVEFEAGDGLFTVGMPVDTMPVDTMEPPVIVLDQLVNIAPVNVQSGETFCVPVVVNDFDDIASLQFSMGWDPAVLQFTEVKNFGIADLTAAGFNTDGTASGVLAVAWFDGSAQGVTLADGATLFELCFTAVGNNGTSTTIAFTDTPTPREAATANATVPFTQTNGQVTVGMVNNDCPGPITAIATPTNVSCNGESDGSISLEVSGGNSQFTYQWSDPSIGNIPNPTGLAAGVYSVTITSCNGDQVKSDIPSASLTITEPPAILVVATPQNATCFGAADGRINVSLSGGTLPYTYTWSDATLAPLNRPVNAAAGTYSLTITDATGCTIVTDGISISSPSEITATVSTAPASCSGIMDGTATLTPSGGSGGDYTFEWGVADIQGGSSTNIAAGDYMVTITDGNQCTSVIPVTVSATVVVSGTVQVIEDACGEGKGGIQVTPSGGTEPYAYDWDGPVEIGNTNTAENIPTGNYSVTVVDANGCFFMENIEVGGPTATLSSSVDVQNVDCPGDDSGSIALTAAGGFSPYTYSWSNGATTETISNLVEGDYTVTITDSKVCTFTQTYTVGATSNMVVSVEVTKGAPDAEATATVTGGVEPYTYEWCDGQTTETATGLDEGNCSLTVIDALGCTVVQNIDIQSDNPIATIAVSAPITCGGQADGALTVTVEGGSPAYTYAWSNGGTSSTIANLGAGTYEVTVADANGNLGTQSFDLTEPAPIVIDQTELTAVCMEDRGKVCINISGGTTPYKQIRWSTGDEDALCIEDLLPGEYGVIVTDQNDCTQEENFRIINDPLCTPCDKSNMVMTPNDDGRNDAFCISCVDIAPNNHVEVYNRWGQLVFEADNYQCVLGTESDCWRGTTRSGNGVVEEGGYFWILEYDGPDGRVRIRDHITILDEN